MLDEIKIFLREYKGSKLVQKEMAGKKKRQI